jgi:hypothetical protein
MLVKTMAHTRPNPPDNIAQYILDGLDRQGPEALRQIAEHAEDLADWKAAQAAAEMDKEDVVREDSQEDNDRPVNVPAKASVVIKEINNNRYYYYQWRAGDQVKSKYKSPVEANE